MCPWPARRTVPSKVLNRNLQKLLTKATKAEIEMVLDALSCLPKMAVNQYGNYFLQKLIERLNASQRLFIIESLKNNFAKVAGHLVGTHVIQTLVSRLKTNEEIRAAEVAIQKDLLYLSMNEYGTHVVQKLIVSFNGRKSRCLEEFVINYLKVLCFDKNGVCVIKLLYSQGMIKSSKKSIIRFLTDNALRLGMNVFGNYFLQLVIEESQENEIIELLKVIIDDCVQFALDKSASNVIEKVIERKNQSLNVIVAKKLLNVPKIDELVANKFVCFTLRKLVISTDGENANIIKSQLLRTRQRLCREQTIIKVDELLREFD